MTIVVLLLIHVFFLSLLFVSFRKKTMTLGTLFILFFYTNTILYSTARSIFNFRAEDQYYLNWAMLYILAFVALVYFLLNPMKKNIGELVQENFGAQIVERVALYLIIPFILALSLYIFARYGFVFSAFDRSKILSYQVYWINDLGKSFFFSISFLMAYKWADLGKVKRIYIALSFTAYFFMQIFTLGRRVVFFYVFLCIFFHLASKKNIRWGFQDFSKVVLSLLLVFSLFEAWQFTRNKIKKNSYDIHISSFLEGEEDYENTVENLKKRMSPVDFLSLLFRQYEQEDKEIEYVREEILLEHIKGAIPSFIYVDKRAVRDADIYIAEAFHLPETDYPLFLLSESFGAIGIFGILFYALPLFMLFSFLFFSLTKTKRLVVTQLYALSCLITTLCIVEGTQSLVFFVFVRDIVIFIFFDIFLIFFAYPLLTVRRKQMPTFSMKRT
ncbi:MAG: hypothetical protein H6728_17465 [Myxococcales bacterium]|nr:hypothetical protein [Myxococcales bacterium]